MKSPARIALFVIVMAAIFLAACGPAATPTSYEESTLAPEATQGLQRDLFAAQDAAGAPPASEGKDRKSVV